jgi:hypothetical protein
MSQATIGVIGGSGLYEIDGLENIERVTLDTPFGAPSDWRYRRPARRILATPWRRPPLDPKRGTKPRKHPRLQAARREVHYRRKRGRQPTRRLRTRPYCCARPTV